MKAPSHLDLLLTPLGEREVYESIVFCNRCGICQEVCPSYRFTRKEAFSPRGRNQLARLLLEGKLKFKPHAKSIQETVFSCQLCNRCTQTCAGKIPTAQHMLELRRRYLHSPLPGTLAHLMTWRETKPTHFARLLKAGQFLRKMGFVKLARMLQITRIPFFSWVNHADDILPTPTPFLQQTAIDAQKAKRIYLPSLEAQFLHPALGRGALAWIQEDKTTLWLNAATGLFSYTYGDVRQARRTAKRLLLRYAQEGQNRPLVTDSVHVYGFLKNYAQLFDKSPRWAARAQALADRVLFITAFMPKHIEAPQTRAGLCTVALLSDGGAAADAEQKLHTLLKQNFVQYGYKEMAVPPPGFYFINPYHAQAAMQTAVMQAAQTQTGTVFLLCGLSALALDFYLKKQYPCAKASHVIELHR